MYYSCKGVRRGIYGELASSVLFTAGILLLCLSMTAERLDELLFAFGLSLILLGCMLLLRYCLTEYTYTLEGELFTVTERRGRRIRTSARLLLSDVDSAVAVRGRRFVRPRASLMVYDYRPAPLMRDYCVITVTDPDLCEGRERLLILISPDEKMLHLLGA